MAEIDELKRRVDNIEYKDIRGINDELTSIKISLERNNTLTEQSVKANEKLSETMDSFKEAMGEITLSLRESNKTTTELSNKMTSFEQKLVKTNDKMDDKFNELRREVESVDGKSKVDLVEWISTNWFKMVVLIVLGGIAVGEFVGVNPLF